MEHLSLFSERTPPERRGPVGLGGWLILLILRLWTGTALRVFDGVSAIVILFGITNTPLARGMVQGASNAAVGILAAIAAILLMRKSRKGPLFAQIFLIADAAYYVVVRFVLPRAATPAAEIYPWLKPTLYLISTVLCIVYLLRSERVANTYFARSRGHEEEDFHMTRARMRIWEEVGSRKRGAASGDVNPDHPLILKVAGSGQTASEKNGFGEPPEAAWAITDGIHVGEEPAPDELTAEQEAESDEPETDQLEIDEPEFAESAGSESSRLWEGVSSGKVLAAEIELPSFSPEPGFGLPQLPLEVHGSTPLEERFIPARGPEMYPGHLPVSEESPARERSIAEETRAAEPPVTEPVHVREVPPAKEVRSEPKPVAEGMDLRVLEIRIIEGVAQWLTTAPNHPAKKRSPQPDAGGEGSADDETESINEKLLKQVLAICDHAYSVHVGHSATLPNTPDSRGSLEQEVQKWAVAQAAFRLTRCLDVRAAVEVYGAFEKVVKDREYLMAVVEKNVAQDGPGRKAELAEYQGRPGPEIAYMLILQAQRDMFEAEMWAHVASLAGDSDFPERFEDAGAKTFHDSLRYWNDRLSRMREARGQLRPVGAGGH